MLIKQKLQLWSYPRWRTGRIIRRVGQFVTILLLLLLMLVSGAMYQNQPPPTLNWQQAMPAPEVPPDVQSLHSHEGALYAGTDGGGVYRWEAAAQQWHLLNHGLNDTVVRTLHSHGGSLYAGTGGGGVYRWEAAAQQWQLLNQGLNFTVVRSLTSHGGSLYVGTWGGGVYRWEAAAQQWQPLNQGLNSTVVRTLHSHGGSLYAGTWDGGVYRWEAAAQQWQPLNQGLNSTVVRTLHSHGGSLYAGTGGGGVSRWEAAAQQWQPLNQGLNSTVVRTLHSHGGSLYAGTDDGGVYRWDEAVQQWQPLNHGLNDTAAQISPSPADVQTLHSHGGSLYAGTWGGGVSRWEAAAQQWQPLNQGLNDTVVWTLHSHGGSLYAGTDGGGVFRWEAAAQQWQPLNQGLNDTFVTTLHSHGGSLYAGTWGGGVSRWEAAAQQWQPLNQGLNSTAAQTPPSLTNVRTLHSHGGSLYAGTWGGGVYRWEAAAQQWQPLNQGLNFTVVRTLHSHGGSLYAGTGFWGGGVFRWEAALQQWQPLNQGLNSTFVRTLHSHGGSLYAGTDDGGVFRWEAAAQQWQPLNQGLNSTFVRTLHSHGGSLYAGTDGGGVFRWEAAAQQWQPLNQGLNDTAVTSLHSHEGALYAGMDGGGVSRWEAAAQQWQPLNQGLNDTDVRTLHSHGGALYAGTGGGGVSPWEVSITRKTTTNVITTNVITTNVITFSPNILLDILSDSSIHNQENYRWDETAQQWQQVAALPSTTNETRPVLAADYGLIQVGGMLVWLMPQNNLTWADLAIREDRAFIHPKQPEIWAAWGAMIAKAPLEPTMAPAWWTRWRLWVWEWTPWLQSPWLWGTVGVISLLIFMGRDYASYARPFRMPWWAVRLARQPEQYAAPEALHREGAQWAAAVRQQLQQYGDVQAADLRAVPGPFRGYALRRYQQTEQEREAIAWETAQQKQLVVRNKARLQAWQQQWATLRQQQGQGFALAAHAPAVDTLAELLTETLNFTCEPGRDLGMVRAYPVEARTLRLKLPTRFPLLFVAEPRPTAHTVQQLVDAVEALHEHDYFALVVPLMAADAVARLQARIQEAPHVQDLILLQPDDLPAMLMARHPTRRLVAAISQQRDLTMLSPFVINGPVSETMFFGREAETKRLVDLSLRADFALIGNRKIGKTSLLRRTRQGLQASRQTYPLWVDCQDVRDQHGFLRKLHHQLPLRELTPAAMRAAIEQLAQAEGRTPILLMDEVDNLLATEQAQGESLAATWRAMAQIGLCHFIFCGATGLARRLDDPQSVFFNFPQPLALSYLSQSTARKVLTEPLATLGVTIDQPEALLEGVLAATSGHPNLVQYVGKSLVEAANARQERLVLLADWEALQDDGGFTNYFLSTIWGQAEPLEKIITLLAPPHGFTLEELDGLLHAADIPASEEAVDAALRLLEIYAIFNRQGRTYRFVPQAFPHILRRTQSIPRLLRQQRRKLSAQRSSSL